MTRHSDNQFGPSGALLNGFDYDVQVWVKDGIVQPCGHPERLGPTCCNGRIYAGKKLADVFRLEAAREAPPPAEPKSYSLAELRNGTGFPRGARFVMVSSEEA